MIENLHEVPGVLMMWRRDRLLGRGFQKSMGRQHKGCRGLGGGPGSHGGLGGMGGSCRRSNRGGDFCSVHAAFFLVLVVEIV
jgi:hypothetical protein